VLPQNEGLRSSTSLFSEGLDRRRPICRYVAAHGLDDEFEENAQSVARRVSGVRPVPCAVHDRRAHPQFHVDLRLMHTGRNRIVSAGVLALVTACGGTSTTPGPTPVGNAGEWSGTTVQGTPIRFTVSSDEKVTAITIGYSFNSCSGSHTFADLRLETAPSVTCIPGPCPPAISSYRAFGYSVRSDDGRFTTVNGLFLPSGAAEGSAGFENYPSCGTALGVAWRASRR
jgi:hypothetical protein